MGIKEKIYNKTIEKSEKVDINGETIYIKKTGYLVKDWQKINPPVEMKEEQLVWNFSNLIFGGKKNLIRLIFIFLLLSVVYWEIGNLLGDSKEWMDGNKYVIIKRESFDKFCTLQISDYNNYSAYGIITNLTKWNLNTS